MHNPLEHDVILTRSHSPKAAQASQGLGIAATTSSLESLLGGRVGVEPDSSASFAYDVVRSSIRKGRRGCPTRSPDDDALYG